MLGFAISWDLLVLVPGQPEEGRVVTQAEGHQSLLLVGTRQHMSSVEGKEDVD